MQMDRNTSTEDKDTELLSNLKGLFGKKLNLARIKFVTLFILALCKTRKVTYTALAIAFDNKTCKDSNVKRIRNFMKAANFTMELVSKLRFKLVPEKENLTLIMDRTNWKFGEVNINILMIGISYKNVAIPLLFKMLDKRGNSHTEERIALIEKFIS